MILASTRLNVTNNGRRAITLPQHNAKPVKIPVKGTRTLRIFAANAGKLRKWASVGMVKLSPPTA